MFQSCSGWQFVEDFCPYAQLSLPFEGQLWYKWIWSMQIWNTWQASKRGEDNFFMSNFYWSVTDFKDNGLKLYMCFWKRAKLVHRAWYHKIWPPSCFSSLCEMKTHHWILFYVCAIVFFISVPSLLPWLCSVSQVCGCCPVVPSHLYDVSICSPCTITPKKDVGVEHA